MIGMPTTSCSVDDEQTRRPICSFTKPARVEASPAKRRHLRNEATIARPAAEAALETPEASPTTHRVRTTAQLDREARALCERRKFAHQAARWAFENEKGSRAACNSGLFGDPAVVTRSIVEPLIRQLKATGKIEDHRDHSNQILTNVERRQLAAWILACADGQEPKDRTKISTKIKVMLKARHASNKRKKYELACVCEVTPCPYAKWKRCPGMRSQERPVQGHGVCGCTQATAAGLHTSSRAVGGAQARRLGRREDHLAFYEPREVVNAAHSRSFACVLWVCWWCKNSWRRRGGPCGHFAPGGTS